MPDIEYRIANWESERSTCKFHHGPVEECADDERDWFPQRVVCWPTAQLNAAMALYGELHQEAPYHDGTFTRWSKKRSKDFPFRADDGVSFYLSPTDMNPDDDWLGDGAASSPQVESD